MVVRGELIEGDWVDFGGRGRRHRVPGARSGDPRRPAAAAHADGHGRPATSSPSTTSSSTSTGSGEALDPDTNKHIQVAHDAALATSGLTAVDPAPELPVAAAVWFDPVFVREMVDATIGIELPRGLGRAEAGRRPPTAHPRLRLAGGAHRRPATAPVLSAVSVIRNAVTRSDAIIKTPSNDPLTAVAIARTMCEMAPDHPLTKHLAVAYWKGGDIEVEERLYRPEHIEKIVAWGGFASVKHVTRYLQPGLEMIALDPKRSASIIGPEAFESTTRRWPTSPARSPATSGTQNQEGCACARVVYVLSGTDPEGLARLDRLGELIYEAILDLPGQFSTKPLHFDRRAARLPRRASGSTTTGTGSSAARTREGAVIVSHLDEPVDYSADPLRPGRQPRAGRLDRAGDRGGQRLHADRRHLPGVAEGRELRDQLPLFGAQRLVSLGYACSVTARRPAGRDRAAAADVQVDRRRGLRS